MIVTKSLDDWLMVEAKVPSKAGGMVLITYSDPSERQYGEVGILVSPGDIDGEWTVQIQQNLFRNLRPDDIACGWADWRDLKVVEREFPGLGDQEAEPSAPSGPGDSRNGRRGGSSSSSSNQNWALHRSVR